MFFKTAKQRTVHKDYKNILKLWERKALTANKRREGAGYKIVLHMWTVASEVQKPSVDKWLSTVLRLMVSKSLEQVLAFLTGGKE